MNTAEMPARDLVLHICASDGEFRRDWIASGPGPKRVVPLAVAPGADPELAEAIAGAAAQMGAGELLACRTRAAFMYEPVTVLPARPRALLDLAARWGQPEDFVVCLPDESAAVLVSVAGYALGAGPPAFLAALAGPDVAGARDRFATWAREIGDHRLRLVAGKFGSGPASRHAVRAALRPDVPERLSALAAAVRMRHGVTAALRVGRAAVGWGAVAAIAVAVASAPGASHALPVLAAVLWLLLQLFVLARTHTLSWPACLRMAAAGSICAIACTAAEWLLTGSGGTGQAPALAGAAEEVAKLIPLVVFWAAARHRFTRLAAVDYLLLGAASGAGFALADATMRAVAVPGAGWRLAAFLPGWSDAGAIRFPGQAVTTGLVAAGIGLAVAAAPGGAEGPAGRWRPSARWRWAAWLLPPVLLGMALLDHYHYDAVSGGAAVPSAVARLHAALGDGHATRWLLVAALVVAVAVDFAAQRTVADVVPPLPGVPPWAGLARTAAGWAIGVRQRWPAGTSGGGLVRWSAGTVAGAVDALVTVGHDIAFLLVAVRRRRGGRRIFAASLAFARERRELAMREARAGGRYRRDMPPRAELWTAWRRLGTVLGLAGSTAAVALLARAGMAGSAGSAGSARTAGPAGPVPSWQLGPPGRIHHLQRTGRVQVAELAHWVPALRTWFGQFIPAGQVLIVAAAIGILVVLASGWPAPVPLPGRGATRWPRRLLHEIAATPAPGQFVLSLIGLARGLLPADVGMLLMGEPVVQPYQRVPPRQQAMPVLMAQSRPAAQPAAEAILGAPRGVTLRDELDRSGWLFPPDRVRRWLGHAPEFGVAVTSARGVPADPAELAAEFTSALRKVAEAPDALRFDATFRNRPARAVVDRATGAAVFFTPAGEFTGCALLTEEQLYRLVREFRL